MFGFQDIVKRIQGPSDAVARRGVRFLELPPTCLFTLQLGPQRIALPLDGGHALARCALGACRPQFFAPIPSPHRCGCRIGFASLPPGHASDPAVQRTARRQRCCPSDD